MHVILLWSHSPPPLFLFSFLSTNYKGSAFRYPGGPLPLAPSRSPRRPRLLTQLNHFCEMSHRPTLPPLRTLGLPNPCSNLREQMATLRVNDTNDSYDSLPPMRNLSISSSITGLSRSFVSPTPVTARTKLFSSTQHNVPCLPTNSSRPRQGYRLVLSALDDADALLIVPDPCEQPVASGPDSQNAPPMPKMGRGYLLVGEAMHLHLRQKKTLKGARVHPYRFVSPPSR